MRLRPGPALVHTIVQGIFLLFMILVGIQFYFFALWAMGESSAFVARPAAVEGFLPISALLAAKRFFLTGMWDPVHPAGLTIFLLALFTALFLRKGFCGYICPVGAVTHALFLLGRRFGLARTPSPRFYWLWTIPKYLLLCFFLNIAAMDVEQIGMFLSSRYNLVCDTKMLLYFLHPSAALVASLVVAVSGSVLFPSFWCRCLCPYGALLGILSFFSPTAVCREEEACIHCSRCTAACPQGISVHLKRRVCAPECTGCLECVGACPKKGCLSVKVGWGKFAQAMPWWAVAALVLACLAAFYIWAVATGHWETAIPTQMVRFLHQGIGALSHY